MDMELVSPGDAVDLRDGFILKEECGRLCQRLRQEFHFKITGNRTADFLRIDYGCVFFDDTAFLQCLHPHFDSNPVNTHLFS